jgi:pimeloyl-ACP methyl ester carboxylesterase
VATSTASSAARAPSDAKPRDAIPGRPEQMRARYPDIEGVVERDGGWVAYEVYGAGDPPIVFVPPWQIVHSRIWKAQIPDFARRHAVIAWDNRGNGRSDRPTDPAAHTTRARAANLGAVMDAAGVRAAVLVGLSSSSGPILVFADEHPERVLGLVFICPASLFGKPGRSWHVQFEDRLADDEDWSKENIHFWRRDYRAYLEFFFGQAFGEPHSTKQIEDGVGYGLDTDPESLATTKRAPPVLTEDSWTTICRRIHVPTLVIQGTHDRITDVTQGAGLANAIPGARLELLDGGGHIVNARDPVRVNLLLRDFVAGIRRDPGRGSV